MSLDFHCCKCGQLRGDVVYDDEGQVWCLVCWRATGFVPLPSAARPEGIMRRPTNG
jgi:hypothetical protein